MANGARCATILDPCLHYAMRLEKRRTGNSHIHPLTQLRRDVRVEGPGSYLGAMRPRIPEVATFLAWYRLSNVDVFNCQSYLSIDTSSLTITSTTTPLTERVYYAVAWDQSREDVVAGRTRRS
jgi:hypothetical protein